MSHTETHTQTETGEPLDATPLPRNAACAVKLPAFEGPLDLLLHLIRQNEVDIADIPIATIAAQYLEYLDLMRQLDIDVAAEYLVMAATLAHIKSRMLVPAHPDADEEEGEDPRAELARRLAEYAAFRDAAGELGGRPRLGRDVFAGRADVSNLPGPQTVLAVSLFELLDSLRRVLARLPAETLHHEVHLDRVTLRDQMVHVMDFLRERDSGAAVLFEDLLLENLQSRHRVVVTFLAILELAKIQALRIFQNRDPDGRPFGPLRVRLAVSSGARDAHAPTEDVRG